MCSSRVRGWERAIDAQRRIVAAVEQVVLTAPKLGDVAIVSHEGVGTLLLCRLGVVRLTSEGC